MEQRKKLGGTPVSTLKGQESAVAAQVGSKGGNRAGFHKIDKGWNKFRLYPAHPGGESFMLPSVKYFMPADVKGDDGKIERKSKPVFNAKVHGGFELDIVEEYVKHLTTETLSHLQGPALTDALKPINFNGDFNLSPKVEWVSYADKYNQQGKKVEFARLSVTTGTKNKFEGLISTESSDQEITVDPFTDEEDGIAVILTYNPDAKDNKGKKDIKSFYTVELEKKNVDKFNIQLIPTPLTEKEVQDFLKVESLASMYKNVYTLKDFNLALAGLQIIDKECKFGVLKDVRFLELVEQIKAMCPEPSEAGEEEAAAEDTATAADDLVDLDRNALKRLILDSFGQGVIVVRTNFSDEDIRNLIRQKRIELAEQSSEEAPAEELTEEEAPPAETSPIAGATQVTGGGGLAAMRAKAEAKKLADAAKAAGK